MALDHYYSGSHLPVTAVPGNMPFSDLMGTGLECGAQLLKGNTYTHKMKEIKV